MTHAPATEDQSNDSPQEPDTIEIYCSVPLKIHSAGASEVDAYAVDWLVDQGLFEPTSPITQMNIGLFVAAGMPFASEAFVKALACLPLSGQWT